MKVKGGIKMTTIGRLTANLSSFKKAPKPQPAQLDDVGKFLLNRNVFESGVKEPVRNARASAAFFFKQGMMPRGTEDQVVKNASSGAKYLNNVKKFALNLKDKIGKLFTRGGGKPSVPPNPNNLPAVVASGSGKSMLKKLGKFGLIAAGVAALAYVGKKAYDYYAANANTHKVKEGENLWNIAKEDLGKKATNAEIQKRTEEIMKLNGLEYGENGKVIIKPDDKIKLK